MKRMDILEATQVRGGRYYSGAKYVAGGIIFTYNHACLGSPYYQRAHDVILSGNIYKLYHYRLLVP